MLESRLSSSISSFWFIWIVKSDGGAAIAQWIRPIRPPGFESQAHHLRFSQFVFAMCHVEKKKTEAGIGPINENSSVGARLYVRPFSWIFLVCFPQFIILNIWFSFGLCWIAFWIENERKKERKKERGIYMIKYRKKERKKERKKGESTCWEFFTIRK